MFGHDTIHDHIHLVEPSADHSSSLDHLPAVPVGDAQSFVVFVVVAGTAILVANNGLMSVTGILQPKIRSAIALALFTLLALAVQRSSLA